MKKHGRVDRNQGEIVDALRRCGWHWLNLSMVGGGCPDGIASKPGRIRFVEIKTPKGKLTPEQAEFHKRVPDVQILRSVEDAVRLR